MANNNAFIDAIIAGAGGGAQTAWLASLSPGTYGNFKNAILEIATAVDGLILPILPGPSVSQINLMQSITAAVLSGRFPQNATPGTYADIAQRIVVLYNTLASSLNNVPNVYGGGGGSLTNLSNVFWVDYNTTVAPADQNGNVETPFARLAQAIAAVPDNSILLVTPNINYTTEGFLTVDKNINFIALGEANIHYGSIPVMIMTIQATGSITVTFRGFSISSGYGWGYVICATGNEAVYMENCYLSGVDNTLGGTVHMTNCATSIYDQSRGGTYIGCDINVGNVTFAGDMIFRNCKFGLASTIDFSTASIANFDPASYQSLVLIGGTCTLVTVEPGYPIQVELPVVVPGLAAGASAYVDVDVSGTVLRYLQVGQAIHASPNGDMITAGQAGSLAWARVSAAATVRCCFTGEITGGSYQILFAPL
jgi:hypothetical protein